MQSEANQQWTSWKKDKEYSQLQLLDQVLQSEIEKDLKDSEQMVETADTTLSLFLEELYFILKDQTGIKKKLSLLENGFYESHDPEHDLDTSVIRKARRTSMENSEFEIQELNIVLEENRSEMNQVIEKIQASFLKAKGTQEQREYVSDMKQLINETKSQALQIKEENLRTQKNYFWEEVKKQKERNILLAQKAEFEKQLRLMNSELQDQRMAADLKDHLMIASRKEALYNVDHILDSLINKERAEEERIEKE